MAILVGLLLGLSTLAFIGPVFFYLLKSSMESGVKAGIAVALGIIAGDIICVFLALYGSKPFFENPTYQFWLAIIGGILLLSMGLKYIIRPNVNTDVESKIKQKSLAIYFTNGFLVNFVNPFVFAVWLGFVSYNQSQFENSGTALSLIITLTVIFSTDVLKAIFAQKLAGMIRPEKLKKIFRFFGVLMALFGIRLLLIPIL